MKRKRVKIITLTAMPAALLAFTSCSSTDEGKGGVQSTSAMETMEGVPGGSIVKTHKLAATVTAVDALSRYITLRTMDGSTRVIKAAPKLRNFEQIQVGDKVNATLIEQVVVFMRRPDEPGGTPGPAPRETSVAFSEEGARPAVMTTDIIEVAAKVVGLDMNARQASLQFPDGTVRLVNVRPDVDMSKAKLGDQVVIRSTEEMAIKVEAP